MSEVKFKVEKAYQSCEVWADKKYVLKDATQKELAKLYELGVRGISKT